MAYILDAVINRYMIDFTKQSHSYRGDDKCRIIMKNEFFMYRVLMTQVKKHYAALQGASKMYAIILIRLNLTLSCGIMDTGLIERSISMIRSEKKS